MLVGVFVKQVVAVLNSEGNVAIEVKTIQEQLEYKILILLWSRGLLHLTRKREEKVSENIFCVCVSLSVSDYYCVEKTKNTPLIRPKSKAFPFLEE